MPRAFIGERADGRTSQPRGSIGSFPLAFTDLAGPVAWPKRGAGRLPGELGRTQARRASAPCNSDGPMTGWRSGRAGNMAIADSKPPTVPATGRSGAGIAFAGAGPLNKPLKWRCLNYFAGISPRAASPSNTLARERITVIRTGPVRGRILNRLKIADILGFKQSKNADGLDRGRIAAENNAVWEL